MAQSLPPTPWPLDRSLKKLVKECSEWLQHFTDRPHGDIADVQSYLNKPGTLSGKLVMPVNWIWHYYSIAACDAYFRSDAGDLARYLGWSIAFGSLYYRILGASTEINPNPDAHFPTPLWDSNRAASPCMLSDWPAAAAGAYFLIRNLELDQDHVTETRRSRYREGTNDAFYGYFFADALGIESHYQSASPLVTHRACLGPTRVSRSGADPEQLRSWQ